QGGDSPVPIAIMMQLLRGSSLFLPPSADACLGHAVAEVVCAAVVGECVGYVFVCVEVGVGEVFAVLFGVFGVAVVHVCEDGVDLVAVHGRGEGGECGHLVSLLRGACEVTCQR